MGGSCSKKIADLNTKATVHPIVERLTAGLAVYSQSFVDDFWLVYKNTHIVVSCFGKFGLSSQTLLTRMFDWSAPVEGQSF